MSAGEGVDLFELFRSNVGLRIAEVLLEAVDQWILADAVSFSDDELSFTAVLIKRIRAIATNRNLAFHVSVEVAEYNDDILEGRANPKMAHRVDLSITGGLLSNDIHYIVECKRLGKGATASDYVIDGIRRFVNRSYASDSSVAGMLGYVLEGSIDNWVNRINKVVVAQSDMGPDHGLGPALATLRRGEVRQSRHVRLGSPLTLTHALADYSALPNRSASTAPA